MTDKERFTQDVKEQMKRLFKDIDKNINTDVLNIYCVDWRTQKYSSTSLDSQGLASHPEYGIDTRSYSDKILFSSTEFSFKEGGYLEGAIINATKIAQKLL